MKKLWDCQLACWIVLLIVTVGCHTIEKKTARFGPYPAITRDRIYGIGFPALLRTERGDFTLEEARQGMELIHAMGAKSWRSWMHTRLLLENPTTPKTKNVAVAKELIQIAQKYELEIVAMNHDWFNDVEILDANSADIDDVSIPHRDLTEGSAYMKVLHDYETSWKTLAGLFPEITLWEVGNEWNHDPFLHPMDYRQTKMKSVFSWKEKAAIATDLMYYANRGIKAANPNATVILFAPAPVYQTNSLQVFKQQGPACEINITNSGIAAFLILIYENIKSGHWPSTNTNDYFQALSWHPYSWGRQPGQWWVEMNNLAYQVVCTYGDEGKPVYLTEWGVTDLGDPVKQQENADYIEKAYKLIEAQMPYVKTMHYFRLYQDKGAAAEYQTEDWGGKEEVYYGLFEEPGHGHKPTEKAKRFQKLAGGKGDLMMFAEN